MCFRFEEGMCMVLGVFEVWFEGVCDEFLSGWFG